MKLKELYENSHMKKYVNWIVLIEEILIHSLKPSKQDGLYAQIVLLVNFIKNVSEK